MRWLRLWGETRHIKLTPLLRQNTNTSIALVNLKLSMWMNKWVKADVSGWCGLGPSAGCYNSELMSPPPGSSGQVVLEKQKTEPLLHWWSFMWSTVYPSPRAIRYPQKKNMLEYPLVRISLSKKSEWKPTSLTSCQRNSNRKQNQLFCDLIGYVCGSTND